MLIPAFPLVGAVVNLLAGRRLPQRTVSWVAVGSVALSSVVALIVSIPVLAGASPYEQTLFPWIVAGNLQVSVAFLLDPLSTVMVLVVTGVGLLIHLYSVGYMGHDRSYPRFFTYLNLFMFAMLLLVLASNFLVMFVGWELVGLCSYLLIGYWFERPAAASAGKKAFVTNRVGDFGFLIGLFLIFTTFGSFEFGTVFDHPERVVAPGGVLITAITLLLFLGATGKSAQVPLYVWLPDAMEGPTPVSALIHAATMVTAGVYMVARTSALYMLAPVSMTVVALIGTLTALFAATIALTQTDIKRVLAYSTVSQLGYMFLAAGVGAFGAGIFHLMTHAFFKALLFLGAGSVIHALHEEQDMRRMGGLRRYLPWTSATMIVAWLAIIGFPLVTAGFWSKDLILARTFESGNIGLWLLGVLTAGLTAFYMSRLVFLTFFGEARWPAAPGEAGGAGGQPRESPRVIVVPLAILAVLAVIGGWVGIPAAGGSPIERFLAPAFTQAAEHHELGVFTEVGLALVTLLVVAVGAGIAAAVYLVQTPSASQLASRFRLIYYTLVNKYWIDELYQAILAHPGARLAAFLSSFDIAIVDGAVNGTGRVFRGGAAALRIVQAGYVRGYVVAFLVGAVAILAIWSFR